MSLGARGRSARRVQHQLGRLRTHAQLRGPPFRVLAEPLFLAHVQQRADAQHLASSSNQSTDFYGGHPSVNSNAAATLSVLVHRLLKDSASASAAERALVKKQFDRQEKSKKLKNIDQGARARQLAAKARSEAGGLVITRCAVQELRRLLHQLESYLLIETNSGDRIVTDTRQRSHRSSNKDVALSKQRRQPVPEEIAAYVESGLDLEGVQRLLTASRDLPLFSCGHGIPGSTELVTAKECIESCIEFARSEKRGLLIGVHSDELWRFVRAVAPQVGVVAVDGIHAEKLRLVTMPQLDEAHNRDHLFLLATQMRQQHDLAEPHKMLRQAGLQPATANTGEYTTATTIRQSEQLAGKARGRAAEDNEQREKLSEEQVDGGSMESDVRKNGNVVQFGGDDAIALSTLAGTTTAITTPAAASSSPIATLASATSAAASLTDMPDALLAKVSGKKKEKAHITPREIEKKVTAVLRPDEQAMLAALRAEERQRRMLLHPPRPKKKKRKAQAPNPLSVPKKKKQKKVRLPDTTSAAGSDSGESVVIASSTFSAPTNTPRFFAEDASACALDATATESEIHRGSIDQSIPTDDETNTVDALVQSKATEGRRDYLRKRRQLRAKRLKERKRAQGGTAK